MITLIAETKKVNILRESGGARSARPIMHKLFWLLMLLSLCAKAQEQTERFDIKRFTISGNSLLPAAELDQLVAPFVGSKREYGDIQRALEALELAYRQRGFSAVQVAVPEQELTEGVIKLQVAESVIDKLTINSEHKFFDAANLRGGLPALKEGTTPNTFDLSSQIALNNENPAKQVEVILGISEKEGMVDARINVAESNPVKYSLGMDNTGNSQTGDHRISFSVQHANLFNLDHVLTASYMTSPEKFDQIKIGSLSYRLPLYAYGGAMDFIYAKSNVDAGTTATTAGPLSFTGKGDVFSFKYTHTLPRKGTYSSKLIFGLDYKKYDNECSLGSFGALGCGSAAASVTLRPISLTYNGLKVGPGHATDYSLSLAKNIPGGSKGNDVAFAAVRPSPLGEAGPRADYKVLRLSLTHLRIFQGDWQIRAALNAQYTDQPLLAQEQFGLAGSTAVRGFTEREVARDQGIFTNLEAYTPELAKLLGLTETSLRALAFIDAASGHNYLLAGENQPNHQSLASIGVGLRFGLGKTAAAKLDIARVTLPNGTQDRGNIRGHFNLSISF